MPRELLYARRRAVSRPAPRSRSTPVRSVGPDHDRRRRAGPDHEAHPGRVLRHRAREAARPPSLADAGPADHGGVGAGGATPASAGWWRGEDRDRHRPRRVRARASGWCANSWLSATRSYDLGTRAAEPPVDYPDYLLSRSPSAWPTAPSAGSCSAGAGSARRSPPTRCAGSARLGRDQRRDRASRPGSTTTPTCWRSAAARTRTKTRCGWLRIWLETPFEGGRHVAAAARRSPTTSTSHLQKR